MEHIFIIEDDEWIRSELTMLLENSGYFVTCATDSAKIIDEFLQCSPDLILLDINLPHTDGFALCLKIRHLSQVPIIFVTGRDSKIDELQALSLGGDDYITKPYNIPIFLARINNALKRTGKKEQPVSKVRFHGVTLDVSTCVVTYQNVSIELSKREMQILYYLMTHTGQYVSRMVLLEYLWDTNLYIDDNTLSVNIARVREKLSEIGVSDLIHTKRGMGYRL